MDCELCRQIDDISTTKRGNPAEDIFFDSKTNKFYLIIEEFRYERTEFEIKFCPHCGRRLVPPEVTKIKIE